MVTEAPETKSVKYKWSGTDGLMPIIGISILLDDFRRFDIASGR